MFIINMVVLYILWHQVQFYVYWRLCVYGVGKWWLRLQCLCVRTVNLMWPHQREACVRINNIICACSYCSKALNARTVLWVYSETDKVFVTIKFHSVTASSSWTNDIYIICIIVQAAINDCLLMFPRSFFSDPQISGTLPTQLGQLSALISM